MKYVCGVMIILFLVSAGVQYNDPDPWLWILFYLIAAGITGLAIAGREMFLPYIGAIGYIAGAILVWPDLGGEYWLDVEEARESLGLAVGGVWLAVLSVYRYRRRTARTHAAREAMQTD